MFIWQFNVINRIYIIIKLIKRDQTSVALYKLIALLGTCHTLHISYHDPYESITLLENTEIDAKKHMNLSDHDEPGR